MNHAMKLDKEFVKEISKIANGDGGRNAKFEFVKQLKEVRKELSTVEAPYIYSDCIKKYGRVPVAICTAITIIDRADRLEYWAYKWANEVLSLWWNAPLTKDFAKIDDGLHPSRIQEYSYQLIKLTTEEPLL